MIATLAAFAALQMGDLTSTLAAVRAGAVEANPLAAFLLYQGGPLALASAKVGVLAGVLLILLFMPPRGLGKARFVLQLANVAMAFVVLSNLGLAASLSD